jgi:hypothetical protein
MVGPCNQTKLTLEDDLSCDIRRKFTYDARSVAYASGAAYQVKASRPKSVDHAFMVFGYDLETSCWIFGGDLGDCFRNDGAESDRDGAKRDLAVHNALCFVDVALGEFQLLERPIEHHRDFAPGRVRAVSSSIAVEHG